MEAINVVHMAQAWFPNPLNEEYGRSSASRCRFNFILLCCSKYKADYLQEGGNEVRQEGRIRGGMESYFHLGRPLKGTGNSDRPQY